MCSFADNTKCDDIYRSDISMKNLQRYSLPLSCNESNNVQWVTLQWLLFCCCCHRWYKMLIAHFRNHKCPLYIYRREHLTLYKIKHIKRRENGESDKKWKYTPSEHISLVCYLAQSEGCQFSNGREKKCTRNALMNVIQNAFASITTWVAWKWIYMEHIAWFKSIGRFTGCSCVNQRYEDSDCMTTANVFSLIYYRGELLAVAFNSESRYIS